MQFLQKEWVDLTVGEIVFASEGVKKENSSKGL